MSWTDRLAVYTVVLLVVVIVSGWYLAVLEQVLRADLSDLDAP